MAEQGRIGPPSGAWGVVDCEEALYQLYDFLDGELTEDRRREFQAHLDICAPCVGKYEFEAELRRVITDRSKERVPNELQQRVTNAIDRERLENQS
jgi:mycothiol system anti-sigma-R factor